jgi:hypothetical protein
VLDVLDKPPLIVPNTSISEMPFDEDVADAVAEDASEDVVDDPEDDDPNFLSSFRLRGVMRATCANFAFRTTW